MSGRVRADQLLVDKGLCESRSIAKTLIMAGKARVGADHVIRKPAEMIAEDAQLQIIDSCPYVSRGAYKLIPALERVLPQIPNNFIAADIGASTGGFTDLLLQSGVSKVYAIDVGYGQLHQKLREDSRVVCLEKVNARYLTHEQLPEPVDIMVADLSFISLRLVLPAVAPFLRSGGFAFTLIKPQFEVEKEQVGKGGVVRDEQLRRRCIAQVCRFAQKELNWQLLALIDSPIKGPKGNQETIAAFRGRK